jgi:Uncharacterized protein conserved in bacteria
MNDHETKAVTCCFTGHRTIDKHLLAVTNERIAAAVSWMYARGYRRFIAGGALGFDTYAAYHVLNFKKDHPDVELVLALPYKRRTFSDDPRSRITESADYVFYASNLYTPSCMHTRNRAMVELSSACLCYLRQKSGGTAYTVDYAKKNGLEIYNLFSEDDLLLPK